MPPFGNEVKLGRSKVLYDADCVLCVRSLDFIRRHVREDCLEYIPLNSPRSLELLAAGPPPGDTIILMDEDGRHERSTAVLRLAARLRRPWTWLRFLRIIPRPVRDQVYEVVARNRSRWFGRVG